jgi:photosystem II stability/assembly factor-like uncharacterized protein
MPVLAAEWLPADWKPIPQLDAGQVAPERGEWREVYPRQNLLAATEVPNSSILIAVGDNETVLRSDDAGAHWALVQNTPTHRHLSAIVALDNPEILVAAGDRGLVLRSNDHGLHWEEVRDVPTRENLLAVTAVSTIGEIIAVGDGGVVLRSEDRGVHWELVQVENITNTLNAVAAIPETDLVIAVGGNGTILRSSDRGKHWTQVPNPPVNQRLLSITVVPNTRVLIAVGENGAAIRSDRDAIVWTPILSTSTEHRLLAVKSVRDNLLLAVGDNGTILRSADMGVHWTTHNTFTTERLLAIAVSEKEGVLVAVGTKGVILRSTDGGSRWDQIKDKPFDRFLFSVNKSTGVEPLIAVGDNGIVLMSDSLGAQWRVVPNMPTRQRLFSAVSLPEEKGLIAVGDSGTIVRSEDAGVHWTLVANVPTDSNLLSVTRIGKAKALVAVGDNGTVLRSEDKGQSWRLVEQRKRPRLFGVAALQAGDMVVAVGANGFVMRSEDRGERWTEIQGVHVDQNLLAVVEVPDTTWVIAVGDGGIMLRSEDRGLHWREISNRPTNKDLWTVAADGTHLLVAAGEGGAILRSVDGGLTWVSDTTTTNATLRSIGFVTIAGSSTLVVVGDNGVILRSNASSVRRAASAVEYGIPSIQQGLFGIAWRYAPGVHVYCDRVWYRHSGEGSWQSIDAIPVSWREGSRQAYRIDWQPKFLASGTRIQYAFTCTDADLKVSWQQALPAILEQTWSPPTPFWKEVWATIARNPGATVVVLSGVAWTVAVLLLFRFAPLRLAALHELLPEPLAPIGPPNWVERLQCGLIDSMIWLSNVLLLSLATRPHVLDAWVDSHAEEALKSFTDRLPTVRDRAIAIDLPVSLNGEERSSLWLALPQLWNRLPFAVLVTGPGGSGKTTLACQVARRALSEGGDRLRSGYKVIPLLVERDVGLEATSVDGFAKFHAGLLRVAVAQSEPISGRFTLALLRNGRVMLIVDGLSERSAESRVVYDPGRQAFPATRIIITSRDGQLPGMTDTVQTRTIPAGSLYNFTAAYLERKGASLTSEEIHRACADLAHLLRSTPCTPLLATLWADHIIGNSGGVTGVADLKDRYVRRLLLPPAHGDEQLTDWLLDDLTLIAERELGNRYTPSQITIASAIDALGNTGSPDRPSANERLRILQASRLLEAVSDTDNLVHVAPDPIAEHLVARLRCISLGRSTHDWQVFRRQLERAKCPVDFLAALGACFEHPDYGSKISDDLRKWCSDHLSRAA